MYKTAFKFLPSIGSWIIAGGLQLSGIEIPWLGYSLMAGGTMMLLFPAWPLIRKYRLKKPITLAREQTVPSQVIQPDIEYPTEAVELLDELINEGEKLTNDMLTRGFNWFQEELWVQRWVDGMSKDIWRLLPKHAPYIMAEQGKYTPDEIMSYHGWNNKEASLRIIVDRKLARLRELRSQIQVSGTGGSQTE